MADDKKGEKKKDKRKTDVPVDVAGLVENAFFLGLGALEVTREQVVKFSNDLVDRGRMSQSEAKRFADRLGEVAEEHQQVVRKTVADETDKVMKASGVATKSDIDDLKAEIAELKDALAAASAKPSAD